MKIYVAAKFQEIALTRDAYATLRAAGHEITHDWTVESDAGMEGAERDLYRSACADRDQRGVEECEALIIFPHANGKGQYVELGMALALRRLVIVITNPDVENIFFALPDVRHFTSLGDSIGFLAAYKPKPIEVTTGERARCTKCGHDGVVRYTVGGALAEWVRGTITSLGQDAARMAEEHPLHPLTKSGDRQKWLRQMIAARIREMTAEAVQ